jgi:hypothetical protein
MLSFAGSVFRAAALGLLALFLLTSLPTAAIRVVQRTGYAVLRWREPPLATRRRILGEPYVAAIDRIRQAVPPDGEYLLVNGGSKWEAGPYWMRFELAPRRARFLGLLSELPDGERLRSSLQPFRDSPVVVAFREGQPPLLMDVESFLRELDRLHGRG